MKETFSPMPETLLEPERLPMSKLLASAVERVSAALNDSRVLEAAEQDEDLRKDILTFEKEQKEFRDGAAEEKLWLITTKLESKFEKLLKEIVEPASQE